MTDKKSEATIVIPPAPLSDDFDPIERWKIEQDLKLRALELELKQSEAHRSWFRSPVIVAIAAATFTLFSNLILATYSSSEQRKLEDRKAEANRVLAALDASSPDQAAKNLQFLSDADLISGDLKTQIEKYVTTKEPGEGAVTGQLIPTQPEVEAIDFGNSGPRVALVVGHSARTQGGVSPYMDYTEFTYNSKLANDLCKRIALLGGMCTVVFRPTRGREGIQAAHEYANALGSFLIVELHFNSFNGTSRGTTTYISDTAEENFVAVATTIHSSTFETLGIPNRGIKTGNENPQGRFPFSVSVNPKKTILLESFFGDNQDDVAAASANYDTWVNNLGSAIHNGAKSLQRGTAN